MRTLVVVSAVIVTLGLPGTLHAQPAPFRTAAELGVPIAPRRRLQQG